MTLPEFLSEEWFEAFAAALAILPAAGTAGRPTGGLALGQLITEVPAHAGAAGVENGEVRFTILLGRDGSAALVRNSTAAAEVTLVEDWPTAAAIVAGTAALPDLLAAGKIKLRGDSNALVSAGDLLAKVAPLLAATPEGGEPS